MGYRVLGFVVWKGARFYLRRRFGDTPQKVAAGAAVAVAVGGLALAQRRAGSSE